MQKYAVIVAGGSGTRMGGDIPKQFRLLCGYPVLWWSMKAFHEESPETQLILVLPQDFIPYWQNCFYSLSEVDRFPHQVACGGDSRTASVKNGLALIKDSGSLVAVHDGARPLVSVSLISRGWAAAERYGAGVPAVAVTDSLRRISPEGSVAVDRSEFIRVQTPQVFSTHIIREAYEKAGNVVLSDDASVVEQFGYNITLFEGSGDNLKLTSPEDMLVAELLLKKKIEK